MSKKFVNPATYITPININGMDGRVLRIEADSHHSKREILFIYDQHSNLEKWWGLAVALKSYANVTMIDLPGLGGMDSFYSIGFKPSLNNMADYVAAFIKLRYKRKRLSVIGVGFGFVVLTRMLQRNSDINDKVNMVVSINGYAHKDDFILKNTDRYIMKIYSYLGTMKPLANLVTLAWHNPFILKARYPLNKMRTIRGGPSREFIRRFKIDLIKATDFRTRMCLNLELLNLDSCQSRLNKTLWHITTSNSNQNVSQKLVEQHFRVIFDKYHHLPTKISARMPLVFNDQRMAIKYLPAKIRRELKTHV